MIIAMSEVLGVRPEDLISRDKLMPGELARYIPKGVSPDSLPDLLSGFLFELTERDSNVFLLRYYYFKNVKEIEDILGISSGNVGVILFRIRTKLKSYLKGKASR
jgi:DNA-directed RNA polymerase specialized sigma24 family protein